MTSGPAVCSAPTEKPIPAPISSSPAFLGFFRRLVTVIGRPDRDGTPHHPLR
jgi:hypothetical protein